MSCRRILAIACILCGSTLIASFVPVVPASAGDGASPAPSPSLDAGRQLLPAGQWKVEFANGVVEQCEIRQDGAASVVEPLRSSPGGAHAIDGAFLLTFEDDRTERWTRVGKRFVVEHFFPSSQYPAGKPVLGIARRERNRHP